MNGSLTKQRLFFSLRSSQREGRFEGSIVRGAGV